MISDEIRKLFSVGISETVRRIFGPKPTPVRGCCLTYPWEKHLGWCRYHPSRAEGSR